MTKTLKFFDGRARSGDRSLFGNAPVSYQFGDGNWVQLGGEDLSGETLGRRCGAVAQSGGALVGVVPEALLWPRDLANFSQAVHVEICFEYARLSLLRNGDPVLIEEEIHVADSSLFALGKRLIAGIAAASVKQTRYDPLHSGAAEAELKEKLEGALKRLRDSAETEITLGGESIRISSAQVAGWCQ